LHRLAFRRELTIVKHQEITNPECWGKSPTFRIDERGIHGRIFRKPQNFDIFQNWHGPCGVLGVRRNGSPEQFEKGIAPMFFNAETTNKVFAAAFSLVLSASVMAATILPGSPSMFA